MSETIEIIKAAGPLVGSLVTGGVAVFAIGGNQRAQLRRERVAVTDVLLADLVESIDVMSDHVKWDITDTFDESRWQTDRQKFGAQVRLAGLRLGYNSPLAIMAKRCEMLADGSLVVRTTHQPGAEREKTAEQVRKQYEVQSTFLKAHASDLVRSKTERVGDTILRAASYASWHRVKNQVQPLATQLTLPPPPPAPPGDGPADATAA